MKVKICGLSTAEQVKTSISHGANFCGFILNYPKSHRFIQFEKAKELTNIEKKNTKYVAVLVGPDENILEKIKDLPFDYYQVYDCTPTEIKSIKGKYNIKIIVAITVKDQQDVIKYMDYNECANILLFDSKGYEKSISFDHKLIKDLKINRELMLAGDIQIEDNLENYKEIADIIDISGGLETSGLKDISKINIFLNKIKLINDEA